MKKADDEHNKTPLDTQSWIVKKYVVEHIQVQGATKKEAIKNAIADGDPYVAFVTKITARKQKS